jgi:YesN/AraC family two-component response regulator
MWEETGFAAVSFHLEAHETVNGVEAIRCVEESQPNIVLMDVRMPGMDGIDATRIIKTKVVDQRCRSSCGWT